MYQFTHLVTVYEDSLFSQPSPAFIVCRFLIMAILTGVRYFIVVFISFSLIISNVEYLHMLFSHLYVFRRNAYLDLPPIVWFGHLFICYWAAWAVCIFCRLNTCWVCFFCKYFLPFWGLNFCYCFLCCWTKCFSFSQ